MRWQKAARVLVGAGGLGCAAALYFMTRERPPQVKPAPSPNSDWTATMQTGAGSNDRTRNGLSDAKLSYKTMKAFGDGRVEYTGFSLDMVDGTVLAGDACRGSGKSAEMPDTPGNFACDGHVALRTPEGWTAQADSATYDSTAAVATMPGAVAFTRGKMSGTGTDASYSRETGVFTIQAEAKVLISGADGESSGPVEATATSLTFTRANKAMLFDGSARITRHAETMTANRATLFMSDDEQQFRVIELRGDSKVTPSPEAGSGMTDMQADDIDLAFYLGTQFLERAILHGRAVMLQPTDQGPRRITSPRLNLSTASDGRTLTRLEGVKPVEVRLPRTKDAPERTITAATLVATGDEKSGLTAAVFQSDAQAMVKFLETTPAVAGKPASVRDAQARELRLRLKGQLDAIDQADFQRDVIFKDGGMTGTGDLGTYHEARGLLLLRALPSGPRKTPHVTNDDLDVTGNEIDLHVDTDSLEARGNVSTVSKEAAKGGTAKRSSFFGGSGPVFGFSDELAYDRAKGEVRYFMKKGTSAAERARLIQGDSVVNGDEIVVNDRTRDLTATGRVESVMLVSDGDVPAGGPAPNAYRLSGDLMVYTDALRTATYTGKPATMRASEREIEAQSIALRLAAESGRLERLEARGSVYAKLPNDREGIGDVLVYDAALDQYTLSGQVTLKTKNEKGGGCTRSVGSVVVFKKGGGAPSWPPTRIGGGSEDVPMPCSASIRK